jgi:CcmD family protein
MIRTLCVLLLLVLAASSGIPAQTPASQPAQEGFVPVEDVPGQEQLPAAPLVAAAYGVAWAAVLVYVWMLWRRLTRVERELADVGRRIEGGSR